jgi:hypothetical protein
MDFFLFYSPERLLTFHEPSEFSELSVLIFKFQTNRINEADQYFGHVKYAKGLKVPKVEFIISSRQKNQD